MNYTLKGTLLSVVTVLSLALIGSGNMASASTKTGTTEVKTSTIKKDKKLVFKEYPRVIIKTPDNETGYSLATPLIGVKYPTSTITYTYGSGVSKEYKKVYQKAISTWNYDLSMSNIKVHFKYVTSKPQVYLLQGTYLSTDKDTKSGLITLGLTQSTTYPWYLKGKLVPTLNSYVYLYSGALGVTGSTTKIKQEVATHELGHVMGLDHNYAVSNDIMSPTFNLHKTYQVNYADLVSLKQLYGTKGNE